MVTVSVALCFTVRLPKDTLTGLAVSVIETATPAPDSATILGELVALLVTVSVPLTAPAVVGANFTINCWVAFGAKVTGKDGGDTMLKPGPVIEAAVIVTFWFPVLVKSTVAALLWFRTTLPKARLVGPADSVMEGPVWMYS